MMRKDSMIHRTVTCTVTWYFLVLIEEIDANQNETEYF